MSDITILKEMFRENILRGLENTQAGTHEIYSVRLEEPKDNYFVIIDQMSSHDEVMIIKPEEFKSSTQIFNGNKGECKRADFVIIDEKERVILYIEMKRGKGAKKDVTAQLAGAKCFISYCKEIGKEFWKREEFLDNYQHLFIQITHIDNSKNRSRETLPKRTTRPDIANVHDRPDRFLQVPYRDRLKFHKLIQPYE